MVTKIRVRKMHQGTSYRFRFAHQGAGARKIGDYTFKSMESLDNIEFSFNDNITEDERNKILKDWKHKLEVEETE